MKNRYFNLLILLPFIVLLISGCKKRISIDSVRSAVMTEEICLKACDEMEDKTRAEYEQCKKEAVDWLLAQNCNTEVCRNNALQTYLSMLAKCYEDYKKKLAHVRQCRKACRDKFNLMMEIHP